MMSAASLETKVRSDELPLGVNVAQQLESLILEGSLEPGARLRQQQLAHMLRVSRTPVREALLILQSRGLVSIAPNRGAIVRRVTRRECAETYLVRAELEGLAAQLAAERVTLRDLKELGELNRVLGLCEQALISLTPTDDGDRAGARRDERSRWIEANDRFHDVLIGASGCQRLADTMKYLLSILPRTVTWLGIEHHITVLECYREEHREMIDSLAAHDAQRARRAASSHVMHARDLMLTWLDASNEGIAY